MKINYTKPALKTLRKMPKPVAKQIRDRIELIASNPLKAKGVNKLQGKDNLYRVRFGQWRVIYTIDEGILTITVVKIGARGDVYKNL